MDFAKAAASSVSHTPLGSQIDVGDVAGEALDDLPDAVAPDGGGRDLGRRAQHEAAGLQHIHGLARRLELALGQRGELDLRQLGAGDDREVERRRHALAPAAQRGLGGGRAVGVGGALAVHGDAHLEQIEPLRVRRDGAAQVFRSDVPAGGCQGRTMLHGQEEFATHLLSSRGRAAAEGFAGATRESFGLWPQEDSGEAK